MDNNETKEIVITCILCPQGCSVTLTKTGDEYQVVGNKCKRGKEYAINEMTNPTRTLTTTVKTVFDDFKRLPVKTDKEIPLKDIFKYMSEINSITLDKRLKPGDIVTKNLLNTDVNLIATDNMMIQEEQE